MLQTLHLITSSSRNPAFTACGEPLEGMGHNRAHDATDDCDVAIELYENNEALYNSVGEEMEDGILCEHCARHYGDTREAEITKSDRGWHDEIAREEGMLNGIESYNDWMGY